MKSVDKLREYGHQCCARIDDAIHDCCDEIEAEIAERYQLLPVDADGVPIRPGDKLIAYNERFDVEGIGDGIVIYRNEDDELGELFNPAATVHAKPDPLKELLDDVSKGIICYPRERVTGYLEDNHSIGEAVMLDVRDRLSKLLGGDAE